MRVAGLRVEVFREEEDQFVLVVDLRAEEVLVDGLRAVVLLEEERLFVVVDLRAEDVFVAGLRAVVLLEEERLFVVVDLRAEDVFVDGLRAVVLLEEERLFVVLGLRVAVFFDVFFFVVLRADGLVVEDLRDEVFVPVRLDFDVDARLVERDELRDRVDVAIALSPVKSFNVGVPGGESTNGWLFPVSACWIDGREMMVCGCPSAGVNTLGLSQRTNDSNNVCETSIGRLFKGLE
ncbi:MAG: hypothetical protein R3B58_08805 [Phycisphaerales bacterium]